MEERIGAGRELPAGPDVASSQVCQRRGPGSVRLSRVNPARELKWFLIPEPSASAPKE